MVRRIEQKKRGCVSRTRKNIILIGTEGANKTETLYFSRFNRLNGSYIVRFAKGNDTDYKIVEKLLQNYPKTGLIG